MAEEPKVAERRMVVRVGDRDVVVAAGDPIPSGGVYIENTPNKVDAAANYKQADAADQAADNPPDRVVESFGSAAQGESLAAIAARVAGNREKYDAEMAASNADAASQPADSGSGSDDSPFASAAAASFAAENDLDADSIDGTGADGKITKKDVEKALAAREG